MTTDWNTVTSSKVPISHRWEFSSRLDFRGYDIFLYAQLNHISGLSWIVTRGDKSKRGWKGLYQLQHSPVVMTAIAISILVITIMILSPKSWSALMIMTHRFNTSAAQCSVRWCPWCSKSWSSLEGVLSPGESDDIILNHECSWWK